MQIKKGQKVWVYNGTFKNIKETTIKSSGYKYVTVEANTRKKFHKDTLEEVDDYGSPSFIILDIKKYQEDIYYENLISKLKRFDWRIEREDLEKVAKIIADY